jgi:hypothetical protein
VHNRTKSDRACRLKKQVSNCIALALEADGDPFAAELIDEAAKLAGRAQSILPRERKGTSEDQLGRTNPGFEANLS